MVFSPLSHLNDEYNNLFQKYIQNLNGIHHLYFQNSDDDYKNCIALFNFFQKNSSIFKCVFRGQKYECQKGWRLQTTWHRTGNNPTPEKIFSCLNAFLDETSHNESTLEKLMRAQHYRDIYKIETILLDFTYDLLVALYFAFDEIVDNDGYSTVNILCLNHLSLVYPTFDMSVDSEKMSCDLIKEIHKKTNAFCGSVNKPTKVGVAGIDSYNIMQFKDKEFTLNAFKENELAIIPSSPFKNSRMKKQKGLFIYDMIQYGENSKYGKDLEEFICKLSICQAYPIVIKVHISREYKIQIQNLLTKHNINKQTLGL